MCICHYVQYVLGPTQLHVQLSSFPATLVVLDYYYLLLCFYVLRVLYYCTRLLALIINFDAFSNITGKIILTQCPMDQKRNIWMCGDHAIIASAKGKSLRPICHGAAFSAVAAFLSD